MISVLLLTFALWGHVATRANLVDGRCSICVATGQKSTVTLGACMTTLAYFTPWYDENGKYHNHDGNASGCSMACSHGHGGYVDMRPKCWCGWPKFGPYVKK